MALPTPQTPESNPTPLRLTHKPDPIRIYVACLAAYNNGRLREGFGLIVNPRRDDEQETWTASHSFDQGPHRGVFACRALWRESFSPF